MTGTSKYNFGTPTYHRIQLLLRRLQIRTTYYSYYLRPTTSIYYFLPTTLEAVNATATAVTMSIAVAAPVPHIMKLSALRIATNQNSCLQFVNWPYVETAALAVGAHLASNSSSGLTPELLHSSLAHTCQTSSRAIDATRKRLSDLRGTTYSAAKTTKIAIYMTVDLGMAVQIYD